MPQDPPAPPSQDPKEAILRSLASNPRLAHSFLFAHRHPSPTPPFHLELIDLWHSPTLKALIMAFRGAAKSTLSEECILIDALFARFKYGLILGNSETRAVERLTAIKHELEFNEKIRAIFGDQVGSTWQEKAIVLKNGTAIHAYGRGQSLRGAKYLDARPDIAFVDDLEDDESVLTEEQRAKTLNWFVSVLMPAMDPSYKMRVAGTPLDPESLLMQLMRAPDWTSKVFPIRYLSSDGALTSAWPERFPLNLISQKEAEYTSLGVSQKFAQEYLCEATDPAARTFNASMFKVDTTLRRTWQPTYVFYDPARTTNKTSAMTGKVVWSWVNSRLIIWEASGHMWKPDEILEDMFKVDTQYSPVEIGVEKDGLEEFLMQPLRQAQVVRGHLIPVEAYKAPKGKIDFIKSLQPFFKAGEVVMAQECPDLTQQLLSFPTGKIDVPNALAYALKMRVGKTVYDNFRTEHVSDNLKPQARTQLRVIINATQQYTSGVLLQIHEGRMLIIADELREGPPGDNTYDILQSLSLEAGASVKVYAGPSAYSGFDQVGLLPTLRKIPVDVQKGGPVATGREELRSLFLKNVHGYPAVQISTKATWTLKALSGGYARTIDRLGQISDFPKENMYKVLMEGLESVVALMAVAAQDQEQVNYAYTERGQRYISAKARP